MCHSAEVASHTVSEPPRHQPGGKGQRWPPTFLERKPTPGSQPTGLPMHATGGRGFLAVLFAFAESGELTLLCSTSGVRQPAKFRAAPARERLTPHPFTPLPAGEGSRVRANLSFAIPRRDCPFRAASDSALRLLTPSRDRKGAVSPGSLRSPLADFDALASRGRKPSGSASGERKLSGSASRRRKPSG
jgi:hypothetical protein